MPFLGQDATAAALIPQIQRIEADAKALTEGLPESALHWKPPDGGWSIAQVLQHLTIGNRLYFPPMRALLSDAPPPSENDAPAWRPSLSGRLLIWALVPTNERRIRTTSRLEPGPQPEADPLPAFLSTQRELADIVWRADGLDVNRLRMTSPVNPLFRRLNLGDAMVILVVHAQRHLRQIERIKANPAFPAAA